MELERVGFVMKDGQVVKNQSGAKTEGTSNLK
jgi:hypothetical protein